MQGSNFTFQQDTQPTDTHNSEASSQVAVAQSRDWRPLAIGIAFGALVGGLSAILFSDSVGVLHSQTLSWRQNDTPHVIVPKTLKAKPVSIASFSDESSHYLPRSAFVASETTSIKPVPSTSSVSSKQLPLQAKVTEKKPKATSDKRKASVSKPDKKIKASTKVAQAKATKPSQSSLKQTVAKATPSKASPSKPAKPLKVAKKATVIAPQYASATMSFDRLDVMPEVIKEQVTALQIKENQLAVKSKPKQTLAAKPAAPKTAGVKKETSPATTVAKLAPKSVPTSVVDLTFNQDDLALEWDTIDAKLTGKAETPKAVEPATVAKRVQDHDLSLAGIAKTSQPTIVQADDADPSLRAFTDKLMTQSISQTSERTIEAHKTASTKAISKTNSMPHYHSVGALEHALVVGNVDVPNYMDYVQSKIELEPENPLWWGQMSTLKMHQRDQEGAKRVLNQAMRYHPRDNQLNNLLAKLYLSDKTGPSAQIAMSLLTRLNPPLSEQPDHYALMAKAMQNLGLHADAVETYAALVEQFPQSERYLLGFALSKEAVGQYAEAKDAYRRVIQASTTPRISQYANERLVAMR